MKNIVKEIMVGSGIFYSNYDVYEPTDQQIAIENGLKTMVRLSKYDFTEDEIHHDIISQAKYEIYHGL